MLQLGESSDTPTPEPAHRFGIDASVNRDPNSLRARLDSVDRPARPSEAGAASPPAGGGAEAAVTDPVLSAADLQRWRVASWLGVLGLSLVGLAWPEGAWAYRAWPFVVSAVLIGLPHGAADLVLSAQATGLKDLNWWAAIRGFGGYLLVMGVVILAVWWFVAGVVAAFGLVAAMHFGMADERDLREAGHVTRQSRLGRWLWSLSRGTLVLGLPFVVYPEVASEAVNRLGQILGRDAWLRDMVTVQWGASLAVSIGAVIWLGAQVLRVLQQQWRVVGVDAWEVGLIALACWSLPPMAAVGAYFLCWHALRHSARVAAVASSQAPRRMLPALWRVHVVSLPLLVPSWVAYGLLGWWLIDVGSAFDWAVLLVLLFIIATPSHHLLVEPLLQRREHRAAARRAHAV